MKKALSPMPQPQRNDVEEAPSERLKPQQPENPFRRPERSREETLGQLGIILDEEANRANRRLNLISMTTPIVGTIAALSLAAVFPPTVTTLFVFLFFFVVTGFGITMGLHRYFAHRSFVARRFVAIVLGITGSWAFQGPIRRWVADHRRHHRFSDRQYDPHSPYYDDDGQLTGVFRRFAHAHLLWMVKGLRSSEDRYAADIATDPVASWCSRHYWLLAASGIAAPALIGGLLGGVNEAIACGLWAGFVRVALLHQLTWSVNSFGHMVGSRYPGGNDESRDNPVLALMILGEGLHGFHHRYPNAAVKSPIGLDATGNLILLLERIGLVWKVKRAESPDATEIAA